MHNFKPLAKNVFEKILTNYIFVKLFKLHKIFLKLFSFNIFFNFYEL